MGRVARARAPCTSVTKHPLPLRNRLGRNPRKFVHRRAATPARFGALEFDGDRIRHFKEKSTLHEGWINGGFFVCEPGIFRFIEGDRSSLEADTLEALAAAKQLGAYRHEGFWQCMDTMRDRRLLEGLWDAGQAPWATWLAPAAAAVPRSGD